MSAPPNPEELSPQQAAEYFLDKKGADGTKWTEQTYFYQIREFVTWLEEQGVDELGDLTGWHIEQFERHRRGELAQVSLKGQMSAVHVFLQYCARIEAVDDSLPENMKIPEVEQSEETSDVLLEEDAASALITHYRDSPGSYATVEHTVLELFWNTGARLGGLRGLDRSDYDAEEEFLAFNHRPQTDTPLKNKEAGERVVSIPTAVCDVLDHYIARERSNKHDQYGREPLFAARQGRPSDSSFRAWAYLATHPCLHRRCPHGNQRETCEYRDRSYASQCPSSRSPHQIRTGSITWQLNQGIPLEVVAERVNANPQTIKRYYDKARDLEKMKKRRRQYTSNLDLEVDNE